MSNRLHPGRPSYSRAAALVFGGAATLLLLAGCQGKQSQSEVRTLPDGRQVVVLSGAPGPGAEPIDKPFTAAERAKLLSRVRANPQNVMKLTPRERRELGRLMGGKEGLED